MHSSNIIDHQLFIRLSDPDKYTRGIGHYLLLSVCPFVTRIKVYQGSYRPWKVLESPEIKILRFPGLESPGVRHRYRKTLEKSRNSKVLVLEILLSGSSIAH